MARAARIRHDPRRCVGCFACQVACQQAHDYPPETGPLRLRKEAGAQPVPRLKLRLLVCRQCAEPSCVAACPDRAMQRQPHGLVIVDDSRCTGCGSCVEACRFGGVVVHPGLGKAVKCHLCTGNRTVLGLPYCVQTCPTGALRLEGGEGC